MLFQTLFQHESLALCLPCVVAVSYSPGHLPGYTGNRWTDLPVGRQLARETVRP